MTDIGTQTGTPTTTVEALAAARGGVVLADRDDLATLLLTGADVLRYLHLVTSQHLSDRRPGEAAQGLLLSPKGKIEFAFRLAALDAGAALVDTEAAAAAGLAERLARFVLRYDVQVGQPAAGALSLLGPAAADTAASTGLPVPPYRPSAVRIETSDTAAGRLDNAAVAGDAADGTLVAVHRTALGVDVVGPGSAATAAALRSAGVATAPPGLVEVLRIERGLPRWGLELTDDVIAEEAGLLGSHVHLDKGCYPGQETVARVHNLGQVQRRLAGLRIHGDQLPAVRADLTTQDGRRAGQVRSTAIHPELGGIGLAYVRRTVPTGSVVQAGDVHATVVELPFTPDA